MTTMILTKEFLEPVRFNPDKDKKLDSDTVHEMVRTYRTFVDAIKDPDAKNRDKALMIIDKLKKEIANPSGGSYKQHKKQSLRKRSCFRKSKTLKRK